MLKGQVVKVIAGFYDIEVNNKIYRVRAAGKLRKENMSPIVGDIVLFEQNQFLYDVLPRRNSLIRPKVANIDQAIIVTSLKEPNYSSFLLNKMLAIVEANHIKPIILFTKSDLVDSSPFGEYQNDGYEVYLVSNKNQTGIDELKKIFKNKLTVFTGQTGAGKSSTINSISGLDLDTQEISRALGRGKHTTRVVEIINWMDGKLIDTPGFSSLSFNLTTLELARSYHDFEESSSKCKFPKNCLHFKENDCEVKRKVASKNISLNRYNDYIRLLKEVINENN